LAIPSFGVPWDASCATRIPIAMNGDSKVNINSHLRMAKMYHKNLSTWQGARWED
jgi:hypothetical protein